MNKEHAAIQKQLERVKEEFKEFERKDIKYRCGRAVEALGEGVRLVQQAGSR